MFMFDIESMGVESNSVVLSAACVYFDPSQSKFDYLEMAKQACFVKFDAKEQIEKLHRAVDAPTLAWWNNQIDQVKKTSFIPSPSDLSAMDGMVRLAEYIQDHNGRNQIVWARGYLDQMATESLSRALGRKAVFDYNMWRDVRTYIDLTYGSTNGYVGHTDPAGTLTDDVVVKHDPVWDCVLDVAMMMNGISAL